MLEADFAPKGLRPKARVAALGNPGCGCTKFPQPQRGCDRGFNRLYGDYLVPVATALWLEILPSSPRVAQSEPWALGRKPVLSMDDDLKYFSRRAA
jgi:hypothetical protein